MIQTLHIPAQFGRICPYIKQGDTIKQLEFSFAATDDIDLTGSTIKMQLYQGSSKVFDVSNGNGITIVDSKSFNIDQVDENDFPHGELKGDLEIKLSNGDILTYFNVIYTILEQYTR